jgi:hypothetical protein
VFLELAQDAASGLVRVVVEVRPEVAPVVADGRRVRQPTGGAHRVWDARRPRSLALVGPAEQVQQVVLLVVGDAHRPADRRCGVDEFGGSEVGVSEGPELPSIEKALLADVPPALVGGRVGQFL